VVYIPFENGAPVGKAQDVVTGFIDGDQARGRPVGVGIDGTGALLIADDAGNTVWRVAAADGSVSPQPIGTDQVATGALGAGQGSGERAGTAPADTQSSTATNAQPPATGAPAASPEGQPAGQQPTGSTGGAASPQPAQTQIAPAVSPEGTVQDRGASSN
jgi:hypothetical protein